MKTILYRASFQPPLEMYVFLPILLMECTNTLQSFSVHWKDNGTMRFSSGYIVVDGVAAPGRFLAGGGETFRSGIRSGPNSETPFLFTKAITTHPKTGDPAGTVVLKIMLSDRGQGVPNNSVSELKSASDKMLANLDDDYKTPGGPLQRAILPQNSVTWSGEPLDGGPRRSHVKFFFHYRSSQWLEDNGFLLAASYRPPMVTDIPIRDVLFPLSVLPEWVEVKSDDGSDEGSHDDSEDDSDDDSDEDSDESSKKHEVPHYEPTSRLNELPPNLIVCDPRHLSLDQSIHSWLKGRADSQVQT